MPPGDDLGDQLSRDGALLDELGQQALAEQRYEPNRVPLRQRVPGSRLASGRRRR
jgi:hypothetical protein